MVEGKQRKNEERKSAKRWEAARNQSTPHTEGAIKKVRLIKTDLKEFMEHAWILPERREAGKRKLLFLFQ